MREPMAMTRMRTSAVTFCALLGALAPGSCGLGSGTLFRSTCGGGRHTTHGRHGLDRGARVGLPHALEAVELPHSRQHHVDHDVVQVDEHPLAFARAFDAERTEAALLRLLDYPIGDGFDVTI